MGKKRPHPLFHVGQTVFDKYAQNVGTVTEVMNGCYYRVDYGFGPCLTSEWDLAPYETAATYRKGAVVKVSEVFSNV